MSLTVVFRETAVRNLARIRREDKDLFARTRRTAASLADQPYPEGAVAWGATGVYRLHAGDIRILHEVDDEAADIPVFFELPSQSPDVPTTWPREFVKWATLDVSPLIVPRSAILPCARRMHGKPLPLSWWRRRQPRLHCLSRWRCRRFHRGCRVGEPSPVPEEGVSSDFRPCWIGRQLGLGC